MRRIRQSHPEVTEQRLVEMLPRGETEGYDNRGNRRVWVRLDEVVLRVVIDERDGVVITVWIEGR